MLGGSRKSIAALGASLLLGVLTAAPVSSLAQSNNANTGKGEFGDQFGGYGGAVEAPREPKVPPGLDVFNLTLDQTKAFSISKNFEVVGHSYFKGPWLTPFAQQHGFGASFNTPRVYNGIAYLAGYNSPPLLFGVLIADVRDPKDMRPLSFIPCNPGTRCPYIRVNTSRKILVGTHDTNSANPTPAVGPARAGVGFYDVSDPKNPVELGFYESLPNGTTHGLEIDDRYAYMCANTAASKPGSLNHEVLIVDYQDPRNPQLVGSVHIPGQHVGEATPPQDQSNPDGTQQKIWCHEITLDKNRLYVAWRDAGVVVVDVNDPTKPTIISQLDYVPPFNGGSLGASHSFLPIVTDPAKYPTLAVDTDEIFSCPAGFGRVIDISDLTNPQIISSYRVPGVQDVYDFEKGEFVCPPGSHTSHLPQLDIRSPSLLYNAWYTQGLRAFDLSNPFLPREVGYYISPPYICGEYTTSCGGGPAPVNRHTREEWQDRDTGLLYVTDGSGGGLTVLRWTGPLPKNPPIPGAR
jgi:hypothetical protein